MRQRDCALLTWFAYASLIGCDAGNGNEAQIFDDFRQFDIALTIYKRDHGKFPSTQDGLVALEPNLSSDKAIGKKGYVNALWPDPWRQEYQYRSPGAYNRDSYDIWTLGADGVSGGEGVAQDCGNWPDLIG